MRKIKELSTLAGALLLSLMLCSTVQAMDETENNDTAAKADNFTLGTTIYGGIQDEDDIDIFKCTLTQSGRVTLTMTSYMEYYCIEVLDSTGERLW